MKCSYCGKKIDDNASVCPYCGMIFTADIPEEEEIPSVSNVFQATPVKPEPVVSAQEIPADTTEESIEIIEVVSEAEDETFEAVREEAVGVDELADSITEFDEVPSQDVIEVSDDVSSDTVAGDADSEAETEIVAEAQSSEFVAAADDITEEATKEDETAQADTDGADPEEVADEVGDDPALLEDTASEIAEEAEVTVTYDDDGEAIVEGTDGAELDIFVPAEEITYPEYDAFRKKQEEDRAAADAEAEKKHDEAYFESYFGKPKKKRKKSTDDKPAEEDTLVSDQSDKNGKGSVTLAAFLFSVIAIAVVICGAYFIKNTIPAVAPKETTTASTVTTTEADTTKEEETTQEDTTTTEGETTTEEETTTEATTTGEATTEAEDTTSRATTTKPSTTKPTTTRPTTTRPTTTRPTTTRPTTTRPTTTKPTTTKPTTTDPYGINDVKLQKPSKYLATSFTVYVTTEGVKLRNKPSDSSERILYLSKGGDVTVYAEQGGYYYVRSNRYGVYGWVAKSYTSNTRPTANETINTGGTVSCDKKYSEAKLMTTTNGLNLRKGPGKDYAIITLIPKGYPVKVIGEKKGVSGWVYVVDTTYGYSGWMASAYLK